MKIESTIEPKTSHVKISYDAEMQDVFLAASRVIADHFDAETYSQFARDLENQDRQYDLDYGGQLLLTLIRSSSRTVETDSDRMYSTLSFVCTVTLHMLQKGRGRNTGPLVRVLTILANIAPVPVLSIPLPPANEVLDRKKTPPEIWKTYQNLRTSPKSETPFLSVAQSHELLSELEKIASSSSSLKDLLVFLNASCLFYRTILEALAAANETSAPQGKAQK